MIPSMVVLRSPVRSIRTTSATAIVVLVPSIRENCTERAVRTSQQLDNVLASRIILTRFFGRIGDRHPYVQRSAVTLGRHKGQSIQISPQV